jgi:hypothetical protein
VSIEEQDQIFGRLTRQSGESRRRATALHAKVEAFRTELIEIPKTLKDFWGPDALGPDGAIAKAIQAAQRIPDRQSVIESLEELRTELERLKELASHLARLA